jgi:adiponectin receptor
MPYTHQLINHSTGYNPMYLMSLVWLLLMGIFYLGGLTILMTHFPERYSTSGKFDYILSSHQIWHICVFMAALVWLYCVNALYAWRMENLCTADAIATWGL